MTVHIDPKAIVHPTAKLADGVHIGPFAIIGEDVTIGTETAIGAHVVIERWTTIGARCRIGTSTVLGGDPQHTRYDGSPSYLHIGDDNDIRELVVIQRSMSPGGCTRLGAHNFIMAQAHIAHDCVLGNHTIVSSLTGLAGHVEVGDGAVLGGVTGVHQFVRIGAYSMVGGSSRLMQDVPPFLLAAGSPATIHGLNTVGLRRAGFSHETRRELKIAYRTLYRSGLNVSQALHTIQCQLTPGDPVKHLIHFIEHSQRGICS
ncbi:MAG: acyl-ACP--UDP-N-acetylglucosamine O-acyltransferase [Candidatus Tectomicrobia bacterium]|uniref:Acyl-ACP--UDP-N-acetylglucosamine O-acyltransferase n=1 Tax=Tectimicrobiota bacterium TaxID=2528274 RepID=A0A937W191_UNCTE|nr:acyl-ACP--UDP-N-acetylglucosamine O-acyltransferase [Candidatus Tectomicrobia bacterium]